MLENNPDNIKRFVPPQRNRSLNRRKSGGIPGQWQCSISCCSFGGADQHNLLEMGIFLFIEVQKFSTCNGKITDEDRFEKNNYHGIDGDKNQASLAKKFSSINHGDSGSGYIQNESSYTGLVALDGCSSSEAAQLLSERWAAILRSYNDQSLDISERPILYSGASGSSWGHLKLPHQMDFTAELKHAIDSAQSNSAPICGDHI